MKRDVSTQTISDFGTQWTSYSKDTGFFGSSGLLEDFLTPFQCNKFKDKVVADIGAGGGRFTLALLELGASTVIAVEPSDAVRVLRQKVEALNAQGRVVVVNDTADKIPSNFNLDYAVSVGVIHHIPEPEPVIKAAYNALKPGGQFVVWLYGLEGSRTYLFFILPLRKLTKRLPHKWKELFSRILDIPLYIYMRTCVRFPQLNLPLRDYMTNIMQRLDPKMRRIVIYDQLSPHYAKYYTRRGVEKLMSCAPFNTEIHQRRGYSWVAIGTKPNE